MSSRYSAAIREFTSTLTCMRCARAAVLAWTCGKLIPCVVFETGRARASARVESCSETIQSRHAIGLRAPTQILEEPKRATAGAVHLAVHTLDVVLVAIAQGLDECVFIATHGAGGSGNRGNLFGHCCARRHSAH